MNEKKALREVIAAWIARLQAQETEEAQFSPAELYDFLLDPEHHPRRDEIVKALGESASVSALLTEMAASRREAAARLAGWDIALPKAAAVAGERAGRIITEGGKYTIEIRPHLDKPNHGLVVVRVATAYREDLEGKELVLEDSRRQVLIKGRVVDGEVSNELDQLDQIEYGFVVRTMRSEG